MGAPSHPLVESTFVPQAFAAARGTAPGSRAALSGTFPQSARGRPSIARICRDRAACRPSTPGRLNLRGKSCHRRKALRRARRRGSTTPGRTLPTRLLSRITSARPTWPVRRPQPTIRRLLRRITHRLRRSSITRLRRRPSTSPRPDRVANAQGTKARYISAGLFVGTSFKFAAHVLTR